MSIKVMSWVWSDCKQVSGNALLVLLALADYADDNGGNCFPALKTIAEKSRISKATVVRTLDDLEEQGLVKRQRLGGKPGDAWKSTHYYIQVPWVLSQRDTCHLSQSETTLVSPMRQPLSHSYETRSTNESPINSSRAAQPPAEPELSPEDLWCERLGIVMTPDDIEARNRLRKAGATIEDYESARAWWTSPSGPRSPIHKLMQLEKSIDRARLTRLQSAALSGDPTKTPGKSRSEKLAEIEQARQERIAKKRKEREAFEAAYVNSGSGNSAGQASGLAPGIATVGD